jgi:hypothetical protein
MVLPAADPAYPAYPPVDYPANYPTSPAGPIDGRDGR